MKKQQIFWNHLSYADQVRAMNLISDLIQEQKDPMLKVSLAAALIELEIWSNGPVESAQMLAEVDLADEDIDIDEDGNPIIKTYIH